MSSSIPPLDASGIFTSQLHYTLAQNLPSAQEERGNRQLDEARTLALNDEPLMNPRDLEIVKERLI
jgi:hypothetical protein